MDAENKRDGGKEEMKETAFLAAAMAVFGAMSCAGGEQQHAFPDVRLEQNETALSLSINGKRYVPLIFAFARTHYVARGADFDYVNDVVYKQIRQLYDVGVRIFNPCMPEIGYGPDGKFDYTNFDIVMQRLVEVCPEAFYILRIVIPPPPLPKDEQILVSRRPGDTSDAQASQIFDQISLFSETYRDYAPGAMAAVMAHIASHPYSERIIGTVICGAGFEWNWGNPSAPWGLMMDISPTVTREFGRWLERKYDTVEALRAAWGDTAVELTSPPLPGLEDRTLSDIGGFRDSSRPSSRWIQDFLDCYNDQPNRLLVPIFDRVAEDGPPLFHGVFGLATMNTSYGGVQTMPGVFTPILEHPALKFIVCCLTYGDRKAGGVSVYMNTAIKSHELHGKMSIGEADIRPSTASDGWNEASIDDAVASMRREFAAMLLCRRHGIWYFDMPGGWFDRPELLEEISNQLQVGKAVMDVPHTNVAETLVVFENRSWKYFGLADHKLELKTVWSGENQQVFTDMTQSNIENLMRLGAPNDAVVAEDFMRPDLGDYKLVIFPFSFIVDPDTRAEIHRRVESGATALFLYAAGITDGATASTDNMQRLLGMHVRVDGPEQLVATLDAEVAERYAIDYDDRTLGNPKAGHFRYDIDDPAVTPLARYADGAVAAGTIQRGKGRIILAATPTASPALYKLAARIAGVHLYCDTDDALYASGEFLVLHTRTAEKKRLRFPRVVPWVEEVFSGEQLGRDVRELTVELPAKTTAVYRLGENVPDAEQETNQ